MEIPTGYAQVSLIFSGVNVPNGAAVVFGVKNDVAGSAIGVASTVGGVFASSGLLARLTSDITFVRTDCKLGPNETGPIGSSTTGAGNGAQSASSEPPNTAMLVTKITDIGGRRGRGRMFFPGVDSGNVNDDGTIGSTYLAAYQTDVDDFLNGLAAGQVPMYLLHGPKTEWQLIGGQPRRVPVAGAIPDPYEVIGLQCDNVVATQRRRLR